MTDQPEAVALLEQLRSQVATLQTSQIPRWRVDVIEALDRIFGVDSVEGREFQSLRFSPLGPGVRRMKGFAQTAEVLIGTNDLTPSIDLAWEGFLRERLQEADEFLVGVIAGFRQPGN